MAASDTSVDVLFVEGLWDSPIRRDTCIAEELREHSPPWREFVDRHHLRTATIEITSNHEHDDEHNEAMVEKFSNDMLGGDGAGRPPLLAVLDIDPNYRELFFMEDAEFSALAAENFYYSRFLPVLREYVVEKGGNLLFLNDARLMGFAEQMWTQTLENGATDHGFSAEYQRFREQMFEEKQRRFDACQRTLRGISFPTPPHSAWMADLFGFGNFFDSFTHKEMLNEGDSSGGMVVVHAGYGARGLGSVFYSGEKHLMRGPDGMNPDHFGTASNEMLGARRAGHRGPRGPAVEDTRNWYRLVTRLIVGHALPKIQVRLLNDGEEDPSYGVFAARKVPDGEAILIESAVVGYGANMNHEARFRQRLHDPVLMRDREHIGYLEEISRYGAIQMERDQSGIPTPPHERYPPDSRRAMHRAFENVDCLRFGRLLCRTQEKWMALADSHRHIDDLDVEGDFLQKGRTLHVSPVGLTSEKGRALNGRIGRVVRVGRETGRYGVVFGGGGDTSAPVALKPQNLKTPNGVMRTNEFADGLFPRICRINHSCRPNAVQGPVDENNRPLGSCVLATRDIEKGEEITVSYSSSRGPDGNPICREWRQDLLRMQYGFECACEMCAEEQ